jgi:uncharacterized lipoprotein
LKLLPAAILLMCLVMMLSACSSEKGQAVATKIDEEISTPKVALSGLRCELGSQCVVSQEKGSVL